MSIYWHNLIVHKQALWTHIKTLVSGKFLFCLYFEDVEVQKVCFTLNLWLQSFAAVISVPFFCRAKEAKAPAHGTHQAALPLFRSCLCGNILQSVASLVARVFSSVFRVLRNSFSYPHFVRITHTQTVLALNPKNRRTLGCDAYGAG